MIDALYEDMSGKLVFLRHFNSNNSLLALQRKDEAASNGMVKEVYGITP
jgi:hypothetical protein